MFSKNTRWILSPTHYQRALESMTDQEEERIPDNSFDIDNFLAIFQNPLLEGGDLSTMIATGVGGSEGVLDEHGKPMYRNRRTVSTLNTQL